MSAVVTRHRVVTPTNPLSVGPDMDIAGTKKKIQRATKVAEASYKKMNEMLERTQEIETDLQNTSEQVDCMEYELAEQRVLLEAIAEEQGLDVETLLEDAELPEPPGQDEADTESAEEAQASETPNSPSASSEGS